MKRFFKLLSLTLVIIFSISIVSFARDVSYEESLAMELKELGVFRGVSDTEFDLERAPSRVEALVMLVRILGVEEEVTNGTWKHPFLDVPSWADNYVGYAYSKGLTNGQSKTQFGTGNASSSMYLTFVLRALGYSDANGQDFLWNNPYDFARQVGIVKDGVNFAEFLRADVVLISHSALSAYLKGENRTLAEKLVEAGVFSLGRYTKTYGKTDSNKDLIPLDAEAIYSTCSSAVFFVVVAEDANSGGVGSGFFINDMGVAITNYHVIDSAVAGVIQTTDKNVYNITGVYAYNKSQDWAVIQVDCRGNDYLTIGSQSTVVGGAQIYAIGSPIGLQNTISSGIISNAERRLSDSDFSYIQITAPISPGSSGGALINKYGQVIGITSGGMIIGQNLNLAIPVHIADISLEGKLVSLSEIKGQGETAADVYAPGLHSTNEAFEALKTYVQSVYNFTTDDGQKCYYKSDKSSDDEYEIYVSYDEQTDEIKIKVKYSMSGAYFDYTMALSKYYVDNSPAILEAYVEDEDDTYKKIATGKCRVDKSSFSKDYNYEFDEFEGGSKFHCGMIAHLIHYRALKLINTLFEEYAQNVSADLYSVYNLGYISFS